MKYTITIQNTETGEPVCTELPAERFALMSFIGEADKNGLGKRVRIEARDVSITNIAAALIQEEHLKAAVDIANGYRKWEKSPLRLRDKLMRWLRAEGEEEADA